MAPTRQFEHEAQVSSSSSSSSEEDEEEENSSSSSSEDNDGGEATTKKPISAIMKKKQPETSQTPTPQQPQRPSSSSESDSGSDSDSDSGDLVLRAHKADPTVKPIASKPMEDPPSNSKPSASAKKPRSKSGAAAPAVETPAKPSRSASKRTAGETERGRDSKKAKGEADSSAKKAATENDSKKQLFQRLWSEEDELNILRGMVEYMEKRRADPVADMNAFHEFVKDRVHVEVTKTQLADKVRRLKKKYENNASKGKKGEDRTFSKAHEQRAFELSKKVWGPEAVSVVLESPKPKVNGKANKNQNKSNGGKAADLISSPEVTKMEIDQDGNVATPSPAPFSRSFGSLGVEEEIIRHGLDLIGGEKRKELEDGWEKLRVEEIELYLKRSDLIREQARLVLEALKARR